VIVGTDRRKPRHMTGIAPLLRSRADFSVPKVLDCHNVAGHNGGDSGM